MPDFSSPQALWSWIVGLMTHKVPISADDGLRLSVATVIEALVVLAITFKVSSIAQRVLRRRVLRHLPIEPGLNYTLQRLLHYVVLALGVLFALKIGVGVDFTSFAVVLTALSVGIGLGLKEIASDVAAGFILLFERPVRVGDRVKLPGGQNVEGNICAIDLRTTKIVTNDGLTVIVPNSKLTNEQYVNWSYRNEPVRLHIPIGAVYGTDVDVVRRALLDATRGVTKLVDDPKPTVRLVEFGNAGLEFELLVWTKEPDSHPQIRSDLNFNIERGFREAGIEIPGTRTDLRVEIERPRAA